MRIYTITFSHETAKITDKGIDEAVKKAKRIAKANDADMIVNIHYEGDLTR